MNGQRGKITFMNLVVFLILVLGGFMAFKYIATGIEKKQIKKEVFDSLGSMRGGEIGKREDPGGDGEGSAKEKNRDPRSVCRS